MARFFHVALPRTQIRSTFAAVAGAVLLSGCFAIESDVSAIPDAERLATSPITLGNYCLVEPEFDDDGAFVEVEINDCFEVRFEDFTLIFVAPDDSDSDMVMTLADAGRGATFMQGWEDGHYAIYTAVFADDALAVVAPPALTMSLRASAQALGVELDLSDLPKGADFDDGQHEIIVRAGAPEDVLALLRDASGLAFDRALRDPDLQNEYMTDAVLYVRFEGDPDKDDLDQAVAIAQLESVREKIMRAMTLE